MKLYHINLKKGNFGDDLNPWLWGRLIPQLLDDDERVIFLGVGTLLHDRFPKDQVKVVFGSGAGYRRPPKLNKNWRIYCVRGPLTAGLLGLAPSLAVTDSAYLLRCSGLLAKEKIYPVSFMPHYSSTRFVAWRKLCERVGVTYIDPSGPVETVIASIQQSELLLSEALHGAVAADAFRVPWIAVRYSHRILTFKWRDWCQSISVPYRPVDLPLILETRLPAGIRWRRACKRTLGQMGLGKDKWRRLPSRESTPAQIEEAQEYLSRIPRRSEPILSSDPVSNRVTNRLLEKLEQLRADFQAGLLC